MNIAEKKDVADQLLKSGVYVAVPFEANHADAIAFCSALYRRIAKSTDVAIPPELEDLAIEPQLLVALLSVSLSVFDKTTNQVCAELQIKDSVKRMIGLGQRFNDQSQRLEDLQFRYEKLKAEKEAVLKIVNKQFNTDDNVHWFAHEVPHYGTVQISRLEEHGLVEWDIHFNECWQGPFSTKQLCIQHLMDCIAEETGETE